MRAKITEMGGQNDPFTREYYKWTMQFVGLEGEVTYFNQSGGLVGKHQLRVRVEAEDITGKGKRWFDALVYIDPTNSKKPNGYLYAVITQGSITDLLQNTDGTMRDEWHK